MTVEEIRGKVGNKYGNCDVFPVGMRVLAVDDDLICLRLLEGLLRKCKYQVTTIDQATIALEMLRENKDRFDVVISDVHMPDMDGFKLLELVGLEMDLPVIMLSANSDPKLVMKGVTHGACDYLIKPVRIEELQNIWQHVIRSKKFNSKNGSKNAEQEKAFYGGGEGGEGNFQADNADQNVKLVKRRKDANDEGEENGHEPDDPTTQKKPRIVWSVDLHRKFVAAVNQLGIENAVPKRIRDLMNVEGITRENVASHLQKYRLYLKRIDAMATQEAKMVATLGGKDSSYMRIGSLDRLGDFRTFAGTGRAANASLPLYTQGGMLGRLNSPASVTLHSLPSPALIQPTPGELHSQVSLASQNVTSFQGILSSWELDLLQQNNCSSHAGDFNPMDGSRTFNAMMNPNSFLAASSNDYVMQPGNPQEASPRGGFMDHSSVSMSSFNSEAFDIDIGGSSDFSDCVKSNGDWQSSHQSSKFHPNSLLPDQSFNEGRLPLISGGDNNSSALSQFHCSHLYYPSSTAISSTPEDLRGGLHCQDSFVCGIAQSTNLGLHQNWDENNYNYAHNPSNMFLLLDSPVSDNALVNPLNCNIVGNGVKNERLGMCLTNQSTAGTSIFFQQIDTERPTTDARSMSSRDYILDQTKPQGTSLPQSYDSLNDLADAMTKQEQAGVFDGDTGFDAYSCWSLS